MTVAISRHLAQLGVLGRAVPLHRELERGERAKLAPGVITRRAHRALDLNHDMYRFVDKSFSNFLSKLINFLARLRINARLLLTARPGSIGKS